MTGFKRIIPGTINTGFPCIYDPEHDETVCQIYGSNMLINKNTGGHSSSFSHVIVVFFIYFPVAFILSSAFYVYVNAKFIEAGKEDIEIVEEVSYDKKYPINKDEEKSEGEERISETAEKTSIIEHVPDIGNVVMCYNKEKEGFSYWADRNIPHRFLLTVCRKYVKSLKCEYLYICEEKEAEEEEEKKPEDEKEEEDEEEDEEKKAKEEAEAKKKQDEQAKKEETSVFASFKNYKTEGNPNSKKDVMKDNKTSVKGNLVTKKINNFIYKGKINNFSVLSKPEKGNDDTASNDSDSSWFTPISFEDFKKMAEKKK
tara:strand:- start:9 stop:950 length:942 start_codon:yes stop_codon:yes gene_type:complete